MHAPKLFLLKSLRFLVEAIDALSLFSIVVLTAPPLITYFNPRAIIGVIAPVENFVGRVDAPLADFLRARVRHEFGGMDATPFLIAAILLLVCWACRAASRQLRVDILTMEELETVAVAEEAARNANVAGRLAAIEAATPSEREQVLEVYAQAKRILEGRKRIVAFLAVDVVNSTGMKQGEDPALAERDFRQYRKLVEAAIERHGALKAAWTPDGVMICFASLEGAVLAGQDLIVGLEAFNRGVKSIKADFKVRCGVNSGNVLYDESTRMEEMSDGSIDLTGHMQKYAEPGTIFAAKSLVENQTQWGFHPVDKTVDGCAVSSWSASGAPAA